MAHKEKDKQRQPTGRDARLAAALRENLRRRKAQARGRSQNQGDTEAPAGKRDSKG